MGVADSLDPQSSLWAWLAYDLRRYRIKEGLSQPQLGRIIGAARQTVCNYEANVRRIDDRQAKIMDEHWDTGGHFLLLLTYARRGYDPDWFRQHVQHEARATKLRIYEALLVPGILQTEAYARALLTVGRPKNIDAQVATRMARQQVLNRSEPPELWVLLNQGVLEQPVGGPKVMREQLFRLLEVSDLPNATVRVVPRSAGAHLGLQGAFQVMTVQEGEVAYVEATGGGRLVMDADEVRSFNVKYEQIGADALSRSSSRSLIADLMETMT